MKVLSNLNRYAANTRVSKNMLINRAVSSYIKMLEIISNEDADYLRVINSNDFEMLLMDIIGNRRVYWRL